MSTSIRPLTCDLTAMTPAQRERHLAIVETLRNSVIQIEELPEGYAFGYESDATLFLAAAEFITLESRCCPFFRFTLEMEPCGGPMWLRITGAPETKEILQGFLAP